MKRPSPFIEFQHVSKSFGSVKAVDSVSFGIHRGEFFSLIGPSGCGKTTLLRMLAGFETPDFGKILIDGQDITQTPPHLRNVNMVFQSYALFPHLSVEQNVAFGLEMKKRPRNEIKDRVAKALAVVRLEGFEERMPRELSGGQSQRVALARAIVNDPLVVLLDEPLAALDLKLRREMELELKDIQQKLGTTFVFVTHDQEEAFAMSLNMAVMNHGRLEQLGSPQDLYETPLNRFVAGFVGDANLFPATVMSFDRKRAVLRCGKLQVKATCADSVAVGDKVLCLLRPEWLGINKGTEQAIGQGKIHSTTYLGKETRLDIELDGGQMCSVTTPHMVPHFLGDKIEVCLTRKELWAVRG